MYFTRLKPLASGSKRKNLVWLHADDLTNQEAPKPEIAYNQSTVVARLYFDELIQVVLPMTAWWNSFILERKTSRQHPSFNRFLSDKKAIQKDLQTLKSVPTSTSALKYPPEWLWMANVIGRICYVQTKELSSGIFGISDETCIDTFSNLMRANI